MNIRIIQTKTNLESNSLIRSFLNFFILHPILNNLPCTAEKHIRKTHRDAEEIIEHKTTHKALEVLYRGGYLMKSSSFKEHLFRIIWQNTNNAKGVRNRLKITENEIERHIRYLHIEKNVKKVRLLSIASGSARSFLEVIEKLQDLKKLKIHITFLDKSSNALEYSKGLFVSEGFDESKYTFEWVQDTANNFLRGLSTDEHYHLVEMVGLMDYFSSEKVQETVNSIYEHLNEAGCLITANIMPNSEKTFVTNVVGWRMIYRQPDEFTRLIASAPFELKNISTIVEPMKVHAIVTAVKK